ncbi:MAG TPA: right-handed parallel beta-helix repeat-containing protein, partial [bacterium]|nr:right-handed parallel beta-helix repeat-containing protein [bacterium]
SILNNLFSDNREAGISIDDNARADISQNRFISNKRGIKYEITSELELGDNYFENNQKNRELHSGGRSAATSGVLSQNELWKDDVTLTGDLLVPRGITLFIDEDARIFLPDATDYDLDIARVISGEKKIVSRPGLCDIIVEGKLVALGGRFLPRKERVSSGPYYWGGLLIFGEAEIEKLSVSGAEQGITLLGKGRAAVNNTEITHSGDGCFVAEEGRLTAKELKTVMNVRGIEIRDRGSASLKNSILSQNEEGCVAGDNAVLEISRCILSKNGTGLFLKEESNAIIENSVFAANELALRLLGVKKPGFRNNKYEENTKISNIPDFSE